MLNSENVKLIVGLGNIGDKYLHTYHNIGFWAINRLATKMDIKLSTVECDAVTGCGFVGNTKIILAKPTTFMNLSGKAVQQLIFRYQVDPKDTIIIYDDIDLDKGNIRYRNCGTAGTHNGMKSVIYEVDTQEIPRIRIGVGKPVAGQTLVDYVLSDVSLEDRSIFIDALENVAFKVYTIISESAGM